MFRDFHDKYKCIFIHVPKVAGTSIERVIFQTDKWLVGHVKAIDYINFDKDKFDSYFSFGFVRNPYDRVVSAYHYLRSGGGTLGDKNWSDKNLSKYKSFEEFILDLKNLDIKNNILSWQHFTPQYKYLCDDNKNILVNFVGKLENIENDFKEVLKILGVERKLVHANKSKHSSYDAYYNETTYKIIRDVYNDDFEIFDYDIKFDKSMYFKNKELLFLDYQNDKIYYKNFLLKEIRLKLFYKNKIIDFQKKYVTIEQRIQNHLAYKLGQTLIINSKSIFGILCMPIYIISTILTYNQEQKIYKEKIKKDPSLALPPLEEYPDYKEALKEKECFTYKLGQALIQANKTWYKGGYVKFWFEVGKLKREFALKK